MSNRTLSLSFVNRHDIWHIAVHSLSFSICTRSCIEHHEHHDEEYIFIQLHDANPETVTIAHTVLSSSITKKSCWPTLQQEQQEQEHHQNCKALIREILEDIRPCPSALFHHKDDLICKIHQHSDGEDSEDIESEDDDDEEEEEEEDDFIDDDEEEDLIDDSSTYSNSYGEDLESEHFDHDTDDYMDVDYVQEEDDDDDDDDDDEEDFIENSSNSDESEPLSPPSSHLLPLHKKRQRGH